MNQQHDQKEYLDELDSAIDDLVYRKRAGKELDELLRLREKAEQELSEFHKSLAQACEEIRKENEVIDYGKRY